MLRLRSVHVDGQQNLSLPVLIALLRITSFNPCSISKHYDVWTPACIKRVNLDIQDTAGHYTMLLLAVCSD